MSNKNNFRCRRALNVAEKPTVAKSVTQLLSGNNFERKQSKSQYNPVFSFNYHVDNENTEYEMIFTSVRGHLMNYDFGSEYKFWNLNTIENLYDAEIYHNLTKDNEILKDNLQYLTRQYKIDTLILWLDCDREGENISFEVVDLVQKVNNRIRILRARYSAITKRDVDNAMENLHPPNKNESDGVEIRQKIDLIIGASFTRMQTLEFRNIFYNNTFNNLNVISDKKNAKNVISYGPCQFPTLNFIVERTEKIRKFIPEEFYYIELKIEKNDIDNKKQIVNFNWKRERLFNKLITTTIFEKILDSKECKVTKIKQNPKTRLRPIPLNTVEMTKLISKKLHINSNDTMTIAENLYRKGLISYPRTETQKYKKTELPQLKNLVQSMTNSNVYGEYCLKLLNDNRYNLPRLGNLDDKAHPPIHPVKFVESNELNESEKRVYDLIIRHFLASVSLDAKGKETIIEIEIGEEIFTSKGLNIDDKGYLEIYPFEKWSNSYLPNFNLNENIIPNIINLQSGKTTPPNFLTEHELITLMDKNGIGTDATIHEHIKHIQDRGYAQRFGMIFKPTLIGTALRYAYKKLGIEIYKPYLRANMEKEIKNVCDGKKNKDEVFNDMKKEMKVIFLKVFGLLQKMKDYLRQFLNDNKDYESQININLGNYMRFNNNNNNNNNNDNNDNNNDDDDNNNNNRKKRGRRGRKKKDENNNSNPTNYQPKNNNRNYYSDNENNFANIYDKQENKNKLIKRNNSTNNNLPSPSENNYIRFCPRCQQRLNLRKNRSNQTFFLGCCGYPNCKYTVNINNPGYCELGTNKCEKCNNFMYKIGKDENDNFINICLGNCLNENCNFNTTSNTNSNNYVGSKQKKRKYNKKNNNNGKKKGRRKKNDDFNDEDYDGDEEF